MEPHPGFFERSEPLSLGHLARVLDAKMPEGTDASYLIHDLKPLAVAGPRDLSFLESKRYAHELSGTNAGACLVAAEFADRAPAATHLLITKTPQRAFAQAIGLFYASAANTQRVAATNSNSPFVHPTALIGKNVVIEPGAIVGQEVQIGDGTIISSGAVIGFRVVIGRDCQIGQCASVIHTLIGDRVILHGGVRIGHDGFGFAMSGKGHAKIPQIGRVLIGDDVEIGANTAVDRGALRDTVIGEGTKIDNLVQIAHNVQIGRHCVIVAQCGIAGSTTLGDFVVIGGATAVKDHLTIGSGAQIAARSGVIDDVPPRATYGGAPARPLREWAREVAAIRKLGSRMP
jgi:UDP-3-O-[3-hydroxymyristoyl] glucosamine N-acyltransferase